MEEWMKRYLAGAALTAVLSLPLVQWLPAHAQIPGWPPKNSDYNINIRNTTTDAWVWITIYKNKGGGNSPGTGIDAAYCVGPGEDDYNSFARVGQVRGEVTNTAGCAHPVVKNIYKNIGSNKVFKGTLKVVNGQYDL